MDNLVEIQLTAVNIAVTNTNKANKSINYKLVCRFSITTWKKP